MLVYQRVASTFYVSVLTHCRVKPISSRIANLPQTLWPTNLTNYGTSPAKNIWSSSLKRYLQDFLYSNFDTQSLFDKVWQIIFLLYIGIILAFVWVSLSFHYTGKIEVVWSGYLLVLSTTFDVQPFQMPEKKHGKHVIIFPTCFTGPSPINPHVSCFNHQVLWFSHGFPMVCCHLGWKKW
jgi:hypothetical protein